MGYVAGLQQSLHKLESNYRQYWKQISTANYIQNKVTIPSHLKSLMKQSLKHLLQLLAYYKLQWMATVAAVKAKVIKPNGSLGMTVRPSVNPYLQLA